MAEGKVGRWYRSSIRTGGTLVHARLAAGAENSGKLVAKVKKEARKAAEEGRKGIVLVDGPPGIGCPVVSSLSGAHFVVLVTEPTVSGLHDLRRIEELVKRFGIPSGCVVNKADMNPAVAAEVKEYCETEGITHIAGIPYDQEFTSAMVRGRTIMESRSGDLKKLVSRCWDTIRERLIQEQGET